MNRGGPASADNHSEEGGGRKKSRKVFHRRINSSEVSEDDEILQESLRRPTVALLIRKQSPTASPKLAKSRVLGKMR